MDRRLLSPAAVLGSGRAACVFNFLWANTEDRQPSEVRQTSASTATLDQIGRGFLPFENLSSDKEERFFFSRRAVRMKSATHRFVED